ncbi:hypothetical protein [uncultured Desulfobulbus sp.]|uniref:hypothetical protein n=1 Tax=uncultured Desulfobulbus sp. TaxID=239745 RepID=UPI0029C8B229|nr:hypothetical protein [uncultured Desulfobulbus sp.]
MAEALMVIGEQSGVALPTLFAPDAKTLIVIGQILSTNPADAVRKPKHEVKNKTPVFSGGRGLDVTRLNRYSLTDLPTG